MRKVFFKTFVVWFRSVFIWITERSMNIKIFVVIMVSKGPFLALSSLFLHMLWASHLLLSKFPHTISQLLPSIVILQRVTIFIQNTLMCPCQVLKYWNTFLPVEKSHYSQSSLLPPSTWQVPSPQPPYILPKDPWTSSQSNNWRHDAYYSILFQCLYWLFSAYAESISKYFGFHSRM